MIICQSCIKEMTCIKTGQIVQYHGTHSYSGDTFRCPTCNATVINCPSTPFHIGTLADAIQMPQE